MELLVSSACFSNFPKFRKAETTVGRIVSNRRRLRSQAVSHRRQIQDKLKVPLVVKKDTFQFIDAENEIKYHHLPENVKNTDFHTSPEELASLTRAHDAKNLSVHGGVKGIAEKLLVSLEEGIKSTDLSLRREIYGTNQFAEKPPRSFWMFVWDAFQDLTLMILVFCALVSFSVGLAQEGWPKGTYDGSGIILAIFLVVVITAVSDYKQSLQFRELDKEKKKICMQVTRDGIRQKVSVYDLVVGDVVHLLIGDQVPADGLYLSGYSLLVDESSLTGESEPVYVSENYPFLLGGTKVQDGSGKMLVTAVGVRTEWGNIVETLNQGGEDETPLQVKLNGVATIIGKIGVGFAILTFLVLLGQFLARKADGMGLTEWSVNDALIIMNYFAISVTIIVVAVPEGLPLAVTLSLAFAMKKLMDEKALVRHLSACETMGSATCICTDKTGTLTTNRMVVDKLWMCEINKSLSNKEAISYFKDMIPENVVRILLEGIFENSGSEVVRGKDGKNSVLGTPTETALIELGLEMEYFFQIKPQDCTKLKVEPFNSIKKKMSVLISLPNGNIRAFCKGAPEIILQMCDKLIDKNGNRIDLSENQRKNVLDVINGFACDALRTLCLAYKDINKNYNNEKEIEMPNEGYTLIAVFGIKDPVRPGVREAVNICKNAGIQVKMVTGDNINTAIAIAKECGILTENGLAIDGPEFRNKSPEEMKYLIPKIQVMARSLPSDKHTLVTNLRKMFNEVVAVTGDGTNDAPALHEADIGLAMGIAGTEVAKESADVIIMDDNFDTIINLAKWGRSVYINIQKFVQFQLTVNVVALTVNFVSASFTGSAPLTIVQLLWVNLIMDTFGALALATEPPNDEMMKQPPVRRGDNFITNAMWRNIIGQSVYQLTVLGLLMFGGEQLLMIDGPDAKSTLNTLIFNTFVFCQVFNEINSREIEKINVLEGIFDSWIFSAVVISTVIFQAIIVEFLGNFASTVPLSWQLWLISVLIGSASLVVGAMLKCISVDSKKQIDSNKDGYEPILNGTDSD